MIQFRLPGAFPNTVVGSPPISLRPVAGHSRPVVVDATVIYAGYVDVASRDSEQGTVDKAPCE